MAEHESTEVVPPAPATFDLGTVGDLHGSNEPVTWAGGSLELIEVAEHRPTSMLHRDPPNRKWMTWAIGGSVGFALILAFATTRGGDAAAGDADDAQAIVEIPEAEPELAPEPVPEPVPEKAKAKASKTASRSAAIKRDTTLAGGSEKAAESSSSKPVASKPAASTSKPAASTSKPAAAGASKPAPVPSKPEPSKPAGPNLAPPEDEGAASKAELPDVSGWDDEDAALGDRSAEGL